MSAGFVDELIRLVVKYEGSEVRRGKVDVDQLAASLKSADVAGKTLAGTSGKGGNLGMSMLMLSQFMDDAQYGLRGIMNNVPGLAMAFGAGPGLAGVMSLATLAGSKLFDVLNSNNQAVKNQAGLLERDLRPQWQKTWDEISRGFINGMNPNNAAQAGGFGPLLPGDMGPNGGQNAVDAAKKRMRDQADAAIGAVTGVGRFGDSGIGQAVRDQISKAGGGEKLLTTIVDALVPANAPPEVAAAARDNIAKAMAAALSGENVDGIVQYLRQANQGALADKILQAVLPVQRSIAEAKAREALKPLMEGVGSALRSMDWTAPRMDAGKAAGQFQGNMAAAGVYPEVQQALAEYMNGPGGRAKIRAIPMILSAFGDAGFSQREAYEGLLLVFQLMDRGSKLIPAIQSVINRAMRGGMAAELNAMRQGFQDQQAADAMAMLGIELDDDPAKQSRLFLQRAKVGDAAAAAGAAAADAGPRKRGMVKQDDRTEEEKAAALD